ncbi:MAG: hypothetical protein C4340_06450 [Armatimonadota bacterium]
MLQAIAAAAGANPTATLKIVEVLRGEQVRSLDLSATSPSQEDKRFTMQEGDIIYVRPNVRRVVVLGEVNSPGLHILSDDMQPRISDALALAGGMTRRGPATRISIVRVQPNGEVIRIPVDFSRYLKNAEAERTSRRERATSSTSPAHAHQPTPSLLTRRSKCDHSSTEASTGRPAAK